MAIMGSGRSSPLHCLAVSFFRGFGEHINRVLDGLGFMETSKRKRRRVADKDFKAVCDVRAAELNASFGNGVVRNLRAFVTVSRLKEKAKMGFDDDKRRNRASQSRAGISESGSQIAL